MTLLLILAALSQVVPLNLGAPLEVSAAVWLEAHPAFRVLGDKDCGCDEDLIDIRTQSRGAWKANPTYRPFAVVGDFNGDGRPDAAVTLRNDVAPDKRWVLILTARAAGSPRAFLSGPFTGTAALFYGAPRPKPYRLLIGNFETEGVELMPAKGGRYALR